MEFMRTAREIGNRAAFVPGIWQLRLSGRITAGSFFAQRIMEKYRPQEVSGLPPASLVYLQAQALEREREAVLELTQIFLTINRFAVSFPLKRYEIRYFHALQMRCRQLFSSLRLSFSPAGRVKELERIGERLFGGVFLADAGGSGPGDGEGSGSGRAGEREEMEHALLTIRGGLSRSGAEAARAGAFPLRSANGRGIPPFLWKCGEAKQFFWRVQRASSTEQELIFAALGVSSLSGLMSRLKTIEPGGYPLFSEGLRERARALLEDSEFMGALTDRRAGNGGQAAPAAGARYVWQQLLRGFLKGDYTRWKLKQADTEWYQPAMEAISYLSLEEWKEFKWEAGPQGETVWKKARAAKDGELREDTEILVMSREKRFLLEEWAEQKAELKALMGGAEPPEGSGKREGPGFSDPEARRKAGELVSRSLAWEERLRNSAVLSGYMRWEAESLADVYRKRLARLPEERWEALKERAGALLEREEASRRPEEARSPESVRDLEEARLPEPAGTRKTPGRLLPPQGRGRRGSRRQTGIWKSGPETGASGWKRRGQIGKRRRIFPFWKRCWKRKKRRPGTRVIPGSRATGKRA